MKAPESTRFQKFNLMKQKRAFNLNPGCLTELAAVHPGGDGPRRAFSHRHRIQSRGAAVFVTNKDMDVLGDCRQGLLRSLGMGSSHREVGRCAS